MSDNIINSDDFLKDFREMNLEQFKQKYDFSKTLQSIETSNATQTIMTTQTQSSTGTVLKPQYIPDTFAYVVNMDELITELQLTNQKLDNLVGFNYLLLFIISGFLIFSFFIKY